MTESWQVHALPVTAGSAADGSGIVVENLTMRHYRDAGIPVDQATDAAVVDAVLVGNDRYGVSTTGSTGRHSGSPRCGRPTSPQVSSARTHAALPSAPLSRRWQGTSAVETVEAEVRELVRGRGLDLSDEDRIAMRRLVEEVVSDYEERALAAWLPPIGRPHQEGGRGRRTRERRRSKTSLPFPFCEVPVTGPRRAFVALVSLFLSLLLPVAVASAAEPAEGRVSPSSPRTSWTGSLTANGTAGELAGCTEGICDTYELTIDDERRAIDVKLEIQMPGSFDDAVVKVYDPEGELHTSTLELGQADIVLERPANGTWTMTAPRAEP